MNGEVAVVLLNRSKTAQAISFSLESVGLNASKGYTIKDLWTNEVYQRATQQEIAREVPSHGVVALRIKGESLPFNIFQYKDK